MTPTSIFTQLRDGQTDFDTMKVTKIKRLDSGAIEMDLKSGAHGVFRIDPKTKKRYLLVEWSESHFRKNLEVQK